jgi:hypothetical protein
MAAGVKPRSREAVRHSRRALRATADLVRLNADGDGVFLVESVLEFVADGVENAKRKGALGVASWRVQNGSDVGIFS